MKNLSNLSLYTKDGRGFALGQIEDQQGYPLVRAGVVPQEFVEKYNNGELIETYPADYKRVYVKFNSISLKNMAPLHVRITPKGSLILY